MNRTRHVIMLIICAPLIGCEPPSAFDNSACDEFYEAPGRGNLDGEGRALVTLSDDTLTILLTTPEQTSTITMSRSGQTTAGEAVDIDDDVNVVLDIQEIGATVELRARESNALLLRAGEIPASRQDVVTLMALSPVGSSGPCSSPRDEGFFAGIEVRGADRRPVVAAGTEAVVTIDGEPFIAGAPWAFVRSNGAGARAWGYLVKQRVQ